MLVNKQPIMRSGDHQLNQLNQERDAQTWWWYLVPNWQSKKGKESKNPGKKWFNSSSSSSCHAAHAHPATYAFPRLMKKGEEEGGGGGGETNVNARIHTQSEKKRAFVCKQTNFRKRSGKSRRTQQNTHTLKGQSIDWLNLIRIRN